MILPFTYAWIFKKHLLDAEVRSILDVGSGDGKFMLEINNGEFESTGIELFPLYIKKSKKTGAYKRVLKGDILKLKYKKNDFDAVICSQVIEHIKKKDANKLFLNMEKFASKLTIIGTPNGHFHQDEYDGNELQKHLSHWEIKDFKKRGYRVYGQGLKFIYGEEGLLSKDFFNLPLIKQFLFLVSYLFSPFVYKHPQYAAHLIAVKYK